MAKRTGVKVNLVWPVYRWFRDQELRTGLSKSLLATAALCALRASPEREAAIQWAKLLDEDQITWEEFEAACDRTAKQRGEALKRVVERVLRAEGEGHQKTREVS